MKVKVLEKNKQNFKPIKIELTLESAKEVCDLWHRVNVSSSVIDVQSDDLFKFKANDDSNDLFDLLDDIMVSNKDMYSK